MHFLFWLIWLLAMSLFNGINPKSILFYENFLSLFIGSPIYLLYTYLTVYWFLPNVFLKKRNYLIAIIYFLSLSLLFGYIQSRKLEFLIYYFFEPGKVNSSGSISLYSFLNHSIWVNIPLIMFASVKYIRDYSLEIKQKKELENINLQAELSLLKVQLKPHFLFNTLNNLYSLAIEGSSKTSEGIERITNLLRYILNECSGDQIELTKEINLISNYLELEKIRYDERLLLTFQQDVKNPMVRIAPMILFTFIENCFKHGSSKDAGSPYIHIKLQESEGLIKFVAKNSIPPLRILKNEKQGIGLPNVKKRLNYLYAGRYDLSITEEKHEYIVELTIRAST